MQGCNHCSLLPPCFVSAMLSPADSFPTGSCSPDGSLQRPGQAGTPIHVAGSLRRPLTTVLRPQQIQLYPHLSPAPHSIPAEAGARTNFSHDVSPVLVVRGGESRTPSVCSSLVLDAKDPQAKSETAPKPPASAPPSILVKPESSRNSAEKVGPVGTGAISPAGAQCQPRSHQGCAIPNKFSTDRNHWDRYLR